MLNFDVVTDARNLIALSPSGIFAVAVNVYVLAHAKGLELEKCKEYSRRDIVYHGHKSVEVLAKNVLDNWDFADDATEDINLVPISDDGMITDVVFDVTINGKRGEIHVFFNDCDKAIVQNVVTCLLGSQAA